VSTSDVQLGADGVRLLSRRPSILFKVAHLGSEPSADVATEGLVLQGAAWPEQLQAVLDALSRGERDGLFAVRLMEQRQPLPLLAQILLDRERTDWFPEFISKGRMVPHFQPIVDLRSGRVLGREALMRGMLGGTEVRGGELMQAAESHDALYSFDLRARSTAIEVGLSLLSEEEILFVNLDPRAVLDLEASVRQTWPLVEAAGAGPHRVSLELVGPERVLDPGLLQRIAAVHRDHGALISLDDLSGGADALRCLELVRPDFAKIDRALISGIDDSPGHRRLVAGLVEYAQELGCKLIGVGVERVSEFEVLRDLGVEYGQGYYFGHPTERPMAVDPGLLSVRPQLV
jgi:EAL domain-containing protein (putative c-di-GMP-specific phosphodiesterase class I)